MDKYMQTACKITGLTPARIINRAIAQALRESFNDGYETAKREMETSNAGKSKEK